MVIFIKHYAGSKQGFLLNFIENPKFSIKDINIYLQTKKNLLDMRTKEPDNNTISMPYIESYRKEK